MTTPNELKRARTSPGDQVQADDSLNNLIDSFMQIEKPDVKDLQIFLVSFLKSTNNLNSRVNTIDDRVEALESRSSLHTNQLNNIEDRLLELEEGQYKQDLDEKINAIQLEIAANAYQNESNSSNILYMQQSLMEKEIILKGFPVKPDLEVVLNKFLEKFTVDRNTIKEYYYVSYSKNNLQASADSNQKLLHFIVIVFKAKAYKVEVFKKKSKIGKILFKELQPEITENRDALIKCSNKLSKFNLFTQRTLYKAQQAEVITEYRFHNNFFQVKLSEAANWERVDTHKKIAQINNQIPADNKP